MEIINIFGVSYFHCDIEKFLGLFENGEILLDIATSSKFPRLI